VASWLAGLSLRRSSSWRVLITIVAEAIITDNNVHMTIVEIAIQTDLCERTVKSAVAELVARGLVKRVGRVGCFSVPILGEISGAPGRRVFTVRQELTVQRALREAGLLLGVDAGSIVMSDADCVWVGLERGITFCRGFELLRQAGDRGRARAFVGAVLAFRWCERVGGRPAL
jgi:hypothetical protein